MTGRTLALGLTWRAQNRGVMFESVKQKNKRLRITSGLRTRSSGENSVEVDTESEDRPEGGLAWAERSDRDVEELLEGEETKDKRKYLISL